MIGSVSPHYYQAVDAYCACELERVRLFREGKPQPPSVPSAMLARTLDEPAWFPAARADQLTGLLWGLAFIARNDPELHDTALARMRDVQAELHRYDDD